LDKTSATDGIMDGCIDIEQFKHEPHAVRQKCRAAFLLGDVVTEAAGNIGYTKAR